MNLPVHVFVSVDAPSLEGVKQYYWKIIADHDPQAYIEKVKALIQILDSVPFHQCVVFSNYKSRAEDIVESLNKFGWPCVYIAGGMDQSSRNEAVSKLKSFSIRVLVSTDVAARGIDVDKVTLVINLDLPKDKSTYLHRVGRTGRFGTLGTAISIVNADEFQVLRGFIRETNSAIEEIDLNLVRNQARKSLTNDHFDEAQKKALDDMESHGKLSPELFEEQVKAISLKEDIRKAEKEKKKNMNESKEKLKNSKSKSTKRLPSPSRFFESFRPFPFDQYENVPLRDLIFPR
jgi:superfamily II DNA/RNA helicase